MSRQKSKGTRFETACARWLTAALGVPVERRALHGAGDMGDLFGLAAHGLTGIAECKDYRAMCRADVERWRRETEDERGNADAGFAVLIVHGGLSCRCGATEDSPTFRYNRADVTVADLCAVAGMPAPREEIAEEWISLDLGTLVSLMGGEVPRWE